MRSTPWDVGAEAAPSHHHLSPLLTPLLFSHTVSCLQAADADGSDGIEMDEFIEHFGHLLGASLSEVRRDAEEGERHSTAF